MEISNVTCTKWRRYDCLTMFCDGVMVDAHPIFFLVEIVMGFIGRYEDSLQTTVIKKMLSSADR